MKRGMNLLILCLIFGIFLIEGVSAGTCSDNDRIMKLFNSTNSHGALWNQSYNYDICYSDIFGSLYTEANPHACTGTGPIPDNKVLGLYSVNNSHAERPNFDNYDYDVCYGDLSCIVADDPDPCPANYNKTVVRLYSDTNSHISNASFTNYIRKICCINGSIAAGPADLTNAFWASMNSSAVITQADLYDRVRLMVQGTGFEGETINYTIYKTIKWWFDRKMAEESATSFTTWVANEIGTYWFRAEIEGDIEDSGELVVSASEDNTPPVTEILSPGICEIYFTGETISFTQNSYDVDDSISVKWDFGDDVTSTEYDTTHTYDSGGQKTILLTVTDERGLTATDRTTILVVSSSVNDKYICAYINEPEWGASKKGYDIFFNATDTYAIEASNCGFPLPDSCRNINCIAGPCKTQTANGYVSVSGTPNWTGFANINFSWVFDDNATYKASGMSGAWFNKTFGYPGEHWAKLTASINPEGSTETQFSNYLWRVCSIDLFEGGKWIWWDENSIPRDPLTQNGTCNGPNGVPDSGGDDCCPPGYACVNSTADPLSSLCVLSNEYCASMVVCDDYLTQVECQEDICGRGRLQPGGGCGGTINVDDSCGSEYFTSKSEACKCEWNQTKYQATGKGCILKKGLWSTIYQGIPFVYSCETTTEHGECIDSLMSIKEKGMLIFESGPAGEEPTPEIIEDCEKALCPDYEGTIMCGSPLIKLDFFNLKNLIITVIIIFIVYVVLNSRKEKQKKSKKKKN